MSSTTVWLRGGIGDYFILSMLLHPIINKHDVITIYLSATDNTRSIIKHLIAQDLSIYRKTDKLITIVDSLYDKCINTVEYEAGAKFDYHLSLWNSNNKNVIAFEELAKDLNIVPDYSTSISIPMGARMYTDSGMILLYDRGTSCPTHWSVDNWILLAMHIETSVTPGFRPVLVGTRNKNLLSKHCIDIRGCNIFDTMLAVKLAKAVVCCDSCIKNIAMMYRVPCVMIYDLSHHGALLDAWFPPRFQAKKYFKYGYVDSEPEVIYNLLNEVIENGPQKS